MNDQNKKLVENYIDQYNNKNIDAMLDLFSDDVQFESVSNAGECIKTDGKAQLRDLASMSVTYFQQRRQTVMSWVIDDNHVAVEIDYWCKLAKDLQDGRKAGEELRLRGASFFTIRNRLIARLVDYM
jgi:steroid delta-isomerase-like uncharacterized protein